MFTVKNLCIVIGIGVLSGSIVGFVGSTESAPSAGRQSQKPYESEEQLLQAQAVLERRNEYFDRQEPLTAEELVLNEARSILSRPHTPREARMALQALSGQLSPAISPTQVAGSASGLGRIPDRPSANLGYGYEPAYRPNDNAHGATAGYSGASGASYKYDLSNPGQQLRYEMDLSAQMQDSISIDPRRDLDRSMGQYGGGIER